MAVRDRRDRGLGGYAQRLVAFRYRWGTRMRKIEQFKKMADDYDQMAVSVQDQALRTMFLEFANQWREAAQEAEILDQGLIGT